MTGHTPTPWMQVTLHPESILGNGQLAKHAFSIKADSILERCNPSAAKELAEANAAFIVDAVNANADLVKALREIVAVASHGASKANEVDQAYLTAGASVALSLARDRMLLIARTASAALEDRELPSSIDPDGVRSEDGT